MGFIAISKDIEVKEEKFGVVIRAKEWGKDLPVEIALTPQEAAKVLIAASKGLARASCELGFVSGAFD